MENCWGTPHDRYRSDWNYTLGILKINPTQESYYKLRIKFKPPIKNGDLLQEMGCLIVYNHNKYTIKSNNLEVSTKSIYQKLTLG